MQQRRDETPAPTRLLTRKRVPYERACEERPLRGGTGYFSPRFFAIPPSGKPITPPFNYTRYVRSLIRLPSRIRKPAEGCTRAIASGNCSYHAIFLRNQTFVISTAAWYRRGPHHLLSNPPPWKSRLAIPPRRLVTSFYSFPPVDLE